MLGFGITANERVQLGPFVLLKYRYANSAVLEITPSWENIELELNNIRCQPENVKTPI